MTPNLIGSAIFYGLLITTAIVIGTHRKFKGQRWENLSLVLAVLGAVPLFFQSWQAERDRVESETRGQKEEARANRLEQKLEENGGELRHVRETSDFLWAAVQERPSNPTRIKAALRAYNLAVAKVADLPPTRARALELAPSMLRLPLAADASVPIDNGKVDESTRRRQVAATTVAPVGTTPANTAITPPPMIVPMVIPPPVIVPPVVVPPPVMIPPTMP